MKKSVRTLIGASVAAVLGSTLLLGGAGTLAFWSDTTSSATQAIQSGQLDLGSSAELTMTSPSIKQCTPTCTGYGPYGGGALVPGDVVSVTVNVPVTLVGQNMKAKFLVSPIVAPASDTKASNALKSALTMKVTKIGTTEFALDSTAERAVTFSTATHSGKTTVPVVVEITFPWGNPGDYNETMGGQVTLAADYSLTQVAK